MKRIYEFTVNKEETVKEESVEKKKDGTEVTVAGAAIKFCCNNCQGKAKKLSGDDQLLALIGDAAYKKGGFKVKKD